MIYPNEFPKYKDQGFVKGMLPQNIEKCNKNREMPSGENHWAYGRKISEEHKKIISEANKGKTSWIKGKHWDEKHKELFKKLSTGRKRSVKSINKTILGKQKGVVQYSKKNKTLIFILWKFIWIDHFLNFPIINLNSTFYILI